MKIMLCNLQKNEKLFQFIKFIIVGGLATIIHYFIYLVLEYTIGINPNIAYTMGYIISFIFNYFASTKFTFKTKVNTSNGIKFAGAHFINYLLHMGLLNIFILIGINEAIAPIFVFPIAIIVNFFMVKLALRK